MTGTILMTPDITAAIWIAIFRRQQFVRWMCNSGDYALTVRKPTFPVGESGVLDDRAEFRYRLQ